MHKLQKPVRLAPRKFLSQRMQDIHRSRRQRHNNIANTAAWHARRERRCQWRRRWWRRRDRERNARVHPNLVSTEHCSRAVRMHVANRVRQLPPGKLGCAALCSKARLYTPLPQTTDTKNRAEICTCAAIARNTRRRSMGCIQPRHPNKQPRRQDQFPPGSPRGAPANIQSFCRPCSSSQKKNLRQTHRQLQQCRSNLTDEMSPPTQSGLLVAIVAI